MAGLVPAIHGLRVGPVEVVGASLRLHVGDHAPNQLFPEPLEILGWANNALQEAALTGC